MTALHVPAVAVLETGLSPSPVLVVTRLVRHRLARLCSPQVVLREHVVARPPTVRCPLMLLTLNVKHPSRPTMSLLVLPLAVGLTATLARVAQLLTSTRVTLATRMALLQPVTLFLQLWPIVELQMRPPRSLSRTPVSYSLGTKPATVTQGSSLPSRS